MNKKLLVATKSDKEKLRIFKEKLCSIFNCNLDQLNILFQNRTIDPLMIGYNEDKTHYAVSFDGNKWENNSINNFELFSAIPIPLRGSVWKSVKTFEFFIVTDFINIRTSKPNIHQPQIVYMDVKGNSKSLHILNWFTEMILYDKKFI